MNQIVSLWPFSCNIYSRHGIEAHCLYLQDNYQANIPLLLFGCWCGVQFLSITQVQQQRIEQLAAQWANGCILPLRSLRQAMKQEEVLADGWQQVREQVKQTELLAEKTLLLTLESLIDENVSERSQDNASMTDALERLIPQLFQHDTAHHSLMQILNAAKEEIAYHVP